MNNNHKVLDFISELIYDFNEEKIIVKYCDNGAEILEKYNSIAPHKYSERRWVFDIAVDCVRKMTKADLEYMLKHLCAYEYNHGYGTYIRNTYVHNAKNHFVCFADDISSQVIETIFSIINPLYFSNNKNCVSFYEEIEDYEEKYGERFPEVFEKLKKEMAYNNYSIGADEAIEKLKGQLLDILGFDEFISLFRESYEEYNSMDSDYDKNDYWSRVFPYHKAILYPLEAAQVRALLDMGFFKMVSDLDFRNLSDCKDYIDTHLGLKDEYAEKMALCAWQTCNPIVNNKLSETHIARINLEYKLNGLLYDNEIQTVAALINKSEEELLSIPEMDESFLKQVKGCLDSYGLSLANK